MRITKLRIKGFESFSDSDELHFGNGINLIVGQNNVGKSAILRSMLFPLANHRHRTDTKWAEHELPAPKVSMMIDVSGAEVASGILRFGRDIRIPVPSEQGAAKFLQDFWAKPSIIFDITIVATNHFRQTSYPSHGLFVLDGNNQISFRAKGENGEISINGPLYAEEEGLVSLIEAMWAVDMFYFSAERFAVGKSGNGYMQRLDANSSNLPQVLHFLNGLRGTVFNRLISHLREIFPTVGNMSISPHREGGLEIRIWPTELMEREELSFPLAMSGTGVGQVISILAAVMTVENAVIIIDEINSFLHPAAVKALLRILQTEYRQHQYIISTHSPDVIGFSNPKSIHLVGREGYESSVRTLDLDKVEAFREVAQNLGVSMSDVFAADRIIWVEGATEEICFPYLYQHLIGPMPHATIFTSVVATGDFNSHKRDPALVFDVYGRISAAASPLVNKVAFSFDAERLSEADRADLIEKSGNRLHFLPRRHLECYLLDPDAISAFLTAKDQMSAANIGSEQVADAVEECAASQPFKIDEWSGDIADGTWLAKVDAAKLIDKICGDLTEQRVRFSKKDDSLFLLNFLVEHKPETLEGLKAYVVELVNAVSH